MKSPLTNNPAVFLAVLKIRDKAAARKRKRRTRYTATTIRDGRRHRGQVMRADGSSAWEGAPRYHKGRALTDAQERAKSLNS